MLRVTHQGWSLPGRMADPRSNMAISGSSRCRFDVSSYIFLKALQTLGFWRLRQICWELSGAPFTKPYEPLQPSKLQVEGSCLSFSFPHRPWISVHRSSIVFSIYYSPMTPLKTITPYFSKNFAASSQSNSSMLNDWVKPCQSMGKSSIGGAALSYSIITVQFFFQCSRPKLDFYQN